MVSGNMRQDLLAGIYRPFDARAWARFREWDPDAAGYLERAVEAGLSPEAIADYGKQHGYSETAVNWLRHAAEYLRGPAAAEPAVVTGRITDAEPPTHLAAVATSTRTARAIRVQGGSTSGPIPAIRPPGRTHE